MSRMIIFRKIAIRVNSGQPSQMLVGFCLGLIQQKNHMEDWTPLQLLQVSTPNSHKCWFCNPAGANLPHMFEKLFCICYCQTEINHSIISFQPSRNALQMSHAILCLIDAEEFLNNKGKLGLSRMQMQQRVFCTEVILHEAANN